MTAAFELGPPRDPAELEVFGRVAAQSLAFPPESAAAWMARSSPEVFRLARADGRVVAGLACQRAGQWLGGRAVPAGLVGAVAVAPERRGSGAATALVRALLEELRAAGVPLSLLYPATQGLYRAAGWEAAGVRLTWRLPTAALRARGRGLEVVELRPDAALLEPVHRERARRTSGNLDRTPWAWQRLLEPFGQAPGHAYGVARGGALEGYLVYGQARLPGTLRSEMLVRDWAALTPGAALRLLELVADHRSIVESVQVHAGAQDPCLALLDEQSARIESHWEWMLRVVDVERAFAARGWPPGVAGEVELEVRDAVLPANAGRWVLAVAGEAAELRRGGRGRVAADVRALAPLLTGHAAPLELLASGLVAGDERDLARLGALLAGPAPWLSDFF